MCCERNEFSAQFNSLNLLRVFAIDKGSYNKIFISSKRSQFQFVYCLLLIIRNSTDGGMFSVHPVLQR